MSEAEQDAAARAASPIFAALDGLAVPLDARLENLVAGMIRSAGATAAKIAELADDRRG